MKTLARIKIGDAKHLHLTPAMIVNPEEDFADIIKRFARSPELRGIFVADETNHLLGVITRTDLLDWVRVKLGSDLGAPQTQLHQALRVVSLMHASTAGEVMHLNSHQAAVTLNDSLADALKLMLKYDLIVLPIVDNDNHLIGELKLSELLALAVEEGQLESLAV